MARIAQQEDVLVRTRDAALEGFLTRPDDATGIVIFAHGSGSSRFSSRNRFVAEVLNEAGLATLLFDLLTGKEAEIDQYTSQHRFDIELLAERLSGAVDWAAQSPLVGGLPVGLFGASTGAAAALRAAAARPATVKAVVSRGGRPDLAGYALPDVKAASLFIVGGDDVPVIDMNRDAATEMTVQPRIEIVPGASHLFEEPGTLERAAELARDFLAEHLAG